LSPLVEPARVRLNHSALRMGGALARAPLAGGLIAAEALFAAGNILVSQPPARSAQMVLAAVAVVFGFTFVSRRLRDLRDVADVWHWLLAPPLAVLAALPLSFVATLSYLPDNRGLILFGIGLAARLSLMMIPGKVSARRRVLRPSSPPSPGGPRDGLVPPASAHQPRSTSRPASHTPQR
jgi:hypothetical protein